MIRSESSLICLKFFFYMMQTPQKARCDKYLEDNNNNNKKSIILTISLLLL